MRDIFPLKNVIKSKKKCNKIFFPAKYFIIINKKPKKNFFIKNFNKYILKAPVPALSSRRKAAPTANGRDPVSCAKREAKKEKTNKRRSDQKKIPFELKDGRKERNYAKNLFFCIFKRNGKIPKTFFY